jgi:hypothetical protein
MLDYQIGNQPFFPRQGEKMSMFQANKLKNERPGWDFGYTPPPRKSSNSPQRTAPNPIIPDPYSNIAITSALEVKLEQSVKRR